jgi:multifunctional methyltransferase subunit TRM112
LGIDGFPNKIGTELTSQDCKAIHHALLEYSINTAKMVCKGCGHVYQIDQGIPNMLLQNNEV